MPEWEQNDPSSAASYGIGAVARRFGLPAPTLRTWDQRYGLGRACGRPAVTGATPSSTCSGSRRCTAWSGRAPRPPRRRRRR